MSNYIFDDLLSKYFIQILQGASKLEKLRQQLASNRHFIPNLLYKSLDIDNKDFLSLNDFRTLLKDKNLDYSDAHLRKLIHNYDTDRDFAINYRELLNIVLPRRNEDLREAVHDRDGQINRNADNQPGMQNIHSEVEDIFVNILLQEMSLVEKLAKIAEEMRNSKDFTSYEAFLAVDTQNQRYITESCILNFLRKNGHNVSEEEVKEIIFKLDTDGDGRISYDEFQEIFFPIKLASSSLSTSSAQNIQNIQKSKINQRENFSIQRDQTNFSTTNRSKSPLSPISPISPTSITGDSLKYSSSNFNTGVGSSSIPRGNQYAPTFRDEIYREENRELKSDQRQRQEQEYSPHSDRQENGEDKIPEENPEEKINDNEGKHHADENKSYQSYPSHQRENRNIKIEDNKSESKRSFYPRSPLRNEYLLRSIPRGEKDFKDSKEKFFSSLSSFNRTLNTLNTLNSTNQHSKPYLTSPNRLGYEELNLRATRNTYTSPLRINRDTYSVTSPSLSRLHMHTSTSTSTSKYPIRSPQLERSHNLPLHATCGTSTKNYNKTSTLANFLNDLLILDANCEVYRESLAMKTDANLKDLFALFDYSGRNSISLVDFKEVLKDLNIYAGISELKLVFKRYDSNLDGSLDFSEFCELITPKKFEYAKLIRNRFSAKYSSFRDLSYDTRKNLSNLFKTLIEGEQSAENKRRLLTSSTLFSSYENFEMVKGRYKSSISKEDVNIIFERLDRNRDGLVTFNEFINELIPRNTGLY